MGEEFKVLGNNKRKVNISIPGQTKIDTNNLNLDTSGLRPLSYTTRPYTGVTQNYQRMMPQLSRVDTNKNDKDLPELMLVDTGEKRNITFKDNSPFRAYFTGTDTYLPMASWADTADTYAYSHDGSIYRVPKQGFEPSTGDLNAHLRHDRALNETTLRDFDKLMLAYLGLGTAPITLPAATSNVLMPMVMNPVSTALGIGGYELGSRGFDNVMQRYTGKNWSEYMKDKYNMPEWASGLINPVGILTGGVGSLAGRMYELLGKTALKQGATALGREALAETAPTVQEVPWSNPEGYYVTPQIRRVNFGADVAAGENGGKTGVMKILPAGNKGSNSQALEIIVTQPEVAESAANKAIVQQTSPLSTRSFSAPVRLTEANGTETISKDEIERILQDRLNGRTLSDNEKYELELELFAHGGSNSGKRFDQDVINGTGEDIDLALNNLNRRYNQEAIARGETPKGITTRDLSKGETPYELEELVENGRLRSDAALDESVSGNRGMSNWYSDNQDPRTTAQLYFNVLYGPKDRSSLGNVGLDNPRDRSGVIFTTDGYQYSIDSFPKALKEFWNTLRSGRRFAKLDTQNTHVESNDFGLANRYIYSKRDAPFFKEIRDNHGVIPDDVKVLRKNDGSLVFARKDDTGAVQTYMLRTRDPKDIINNNLIKEQTGSQSKNLLSINEWIDRINNDFGESMGYQFPHARVNSNGEIEWPNMYGVFYKKGGTINNINNGKQKVKIIGNTKKA